MIKPDDPARRTEGATKSSSNSFGRWAARGYTLKDLVKAAWRLEDNRVVGGPKWFDSTAFDIDAKLPADATMEQIPQMIQAMLRDRFGLAFHNEPRSSLVYLLTVSKKGSKLKDASVLERIVSGNSWGSTRIQARSTTTSQFADRLSNASQRPVLDQTGLSGVYSIELSFAPVTPGATEDARGSDAGPSIFVAIEEQLGLKLTSSRKPVEILVVDRASMPTAN